MSANLNIDFFSICDRDVDDVITLLNYFILVGETEKTSVSQPIKAKEQRVRVTDETATGGWF